ncbi:TonB-dependent receptor [Rudanella paleaurantiibacter]|uniref:TonB-dependent receptor n=1 Tax=Rudanella paleaurantiibacter TaxID=2614655 RepID=A0A7J5TY38_9BACT|nr:outer membrane beta-barrel family protein [Rudanella paleaurantiibacter]KAB7729343.1 TonB-dependent receptor [Rudanella paleaurantiibacter]
MTTALPLGDRIGNSSDCARPRPVGPVVLVHQSANPMNKIMYLLFLLTATLSTTLAQTATLSGTVTDATGQPIPFATAALLHGTDSTVTKAAVADAAGVYTFGGVRAGTYRVRLSSLGYAGLVSEPVTLTDGQTTFIPTIVLPEANQNLNAVTVTARKPLVEVQPDKLVLNVEASLTAAGSSAFELLQKAPGVLLDPNDNLIVQGKNGVRVYIDSKPSPLGPADLAAYLRTLQATDIEAVEVITQPSARYDAQGNAGIINIRLRKNARTYGTNGNVAVGVAAGAYYPKYNGSVSLNNRSNRLNLFSTYSGRTGRDWSFINLYRQQSGQFFDQRSQTRSWSANHNARAGADWTLSNRSTLGVLVSGSLRDARNLTDGRTPIGSLGTAPTSLLLANNRSESERLNGNVNLNYRYSDTTGRELTVDADYGRFRNQSDALQPNRYVNPLTGVLLDERNYRMTTFTDINLQTIKADYSQPWLGGKLSVGVKLSSVQTGNGFDFFDQIDGRDKLNPQRTNQFVYTEVIRAGYGAYEKSWKKWQAQLGLRAEQTLSRGELNSARPQTDADVSRRYLNLFPSAGLTFNPAPNHSWAATYSRRIDRPTYQSLNPFESKLDELTYQKGNAFLQPQYTNTIQLSHTFKYKLTTSISYSHTRDFFTEITDTTQRDPDNRPRNYITTRNLSSQDVWSLNVSYPFNIAKWWSVFANVSAYRSTNRANLEGRLIGLSANVLSLYAQHTISLPRGWNLEVSAYYTSPSIWGGTFRNQRFWGSSVGIQRKVLAERGTLVFTVTDPFNSQQWRGISQFGGLYMDASGGWESRQARINFTYAFGSKKIKAARQRKTGLDDESKRL